MPAQLNEFSYDGGAGEFIEIRLDAGESVAGLEVQVYTKSGPSASLSNTYLVSSGAMTSDGTYDYYVLSVPLEDGPRAGLALVDTNPNPDLLISSVIWGATSPVNMVGGILGGTSQPSIGDPLQNSSTTSLSPDGMGGWQEANPTIGTANVCFTRGTLIATKDGMRAIQDLTTGDRVLTMDHGYQEIRWIGSNAVSAEGLASNPKLVPIRIQKGALGKGMPEQDLLVSPQHRVLIRSVISERIFDTDEVLISANKLLTIDGIDIAWDAEETGVEYWHFLFDAHEIVCSNGAFTESLFTGPEALKGVSPEAREEIITLFPQIALPGYVASSARPIPEKGKLMKKLAQRHQYNRKPLVDMQR